MKKALGILLLSGAICVQAQQPMRLDSILSVIGRDHPSLRSSDAEARSLDEAAKGARNWDAPILGTGWWMTPYNPTLWKRQTNGSPGMGQYMLSAEQLIPNRRSQEAEEKYLSGLSAVEKERRGATANDLFATARRAYFEWMTAKNRKSVLDEDGRLLDFMIRDAELKYKDNLGKIGAYYKAKAAQGNLENRRLLLDNTIEQQRILLNTLMHRNAQTLFDIDTIWEPIDVDGVLADSAGVLDTRSDIKAVNRQIRVTGLEREAEQAKLRPVFGVEYDHMFGFGGSPMQYTLMATVRLPMASWSSRAVKAQMASLKWKTLSLEDHRDAMVNEAIGAVYGLKRAILSKQKQIRVLEDQVLPALRKNFQTIQLAYEQNTEELFSLFDAWETLDNTQMEYWYAVESLLMMQVELKRVLETK